MKTVLPLLAILTLIGCGGGGGSTSQSESAAPPSSISGQAYFDQGGLKWSTPSTQTYFYAPLGSSIALNQSNGYYCNGTSNGVLDNFNREPGWRLPTLTELRALQKEMPSPPGWGSAPVWADGNFAVDFKNGNTIIGGNTEASKYHVACVKKL